MKLLEALKCLSPVRKPASLDFALLLLRFMAVFVLTKTRLYARLGLSETKDSVELEDER